ncbi:hypothetical protein Bca52824_024227 [Brassica carinata]|uniref:Uncharacterized protein n=1 Tax=Brassica carinata TaxID=52824 RepID=A0A8X8AU95_BRACI|nr:hypothetical protein Bca52824_024227 [Brassica carinata]
MSVNNKNLAVFSHFIFFIAMILSKCLRSGHLDIFVMVYVPNWIVSPTEGSKLAAKYTGEGFKTLKLKVGKNLKVDKFARLYVQSTQLVRFSLNNMSTET